MNTPLHKFLSPAQVQQGWDLYRSYSTVDTVELRPKGLQKFLRDIGIVVSENQARDRIFAMSQSTSTLQKNKDVDARVMGAISQRSEVFFGNNTTTSNNTVPLCDKQGGSGGKKGELFLTFPCFLELMVATMSDTSKEDELRCAFHHLDADKDGSIGAKDIKKSVSDLYQDSVIASSSSCSESGKKIKQHRIRSVSASNNKSGGGATPSVMPLSPEKANGAILTATTETTTRADVATTGVVAVAPRRSASTSHQSEKKKDDQGATFIRCPCGTTYSSATRILQPKEGCCSLFGDDRMASLAAMSTVEFESILTELDVDGDGKVTVEDFMHALETN